MQIRDQHKLQWQQGVECNGLNMLTKIKKQLPYLIFLNYNYKITIKQTKIKNVKRHSTMAAKGRV